MPAVISTKAAKALAKEQAKRQADDALTNQAAVELPARLAARAERVAIGLNDLYVNPQLIAQARGFFHAPGAPLAAFWRYVEWRAFQHYIEEVSGGRTEHSFHYTGARCWQVWQRLPTGQWTNGDSLNADGFATLSQLKEAYYNKTQAQGDAQ